MAFHRTAEVVSRRLWTTPVVTDTAAKGVPSIYGGMTEEYHAHIYICYIVIGASYLAKN